MTDTPRSRSVRTISLSRSRSDGPREAVGSSMIRMVRSATSARMISSSCWLAIDSRPATASGEISSAPTRAASSRNRRRISPRRTKPATRGYWPRNTLSMAVRAGTVLSSW